MQKYVVGLVFDLTCENLLLIRKEHPEWQAGLYNGIGGKVEPGEIFLDAMKRESGEEAGLSDLLWRPIIHVQGPGYKVQYFYAIMPGSIVYCQNTDEELFIMSNAQYVGEAIGDRMVQPLPWIIACALQEIKEKKLCPGL